MSIIVCYATCWACKFDACPGGWHSWADEEDIERAAKTGQADPSTQKCGCPCTERGASPTEPSDEDVTWSPTEPFPCPVCGEVGGCGTDAEGRSLFHQVPDEDDEEEAP